MIKDNGSKVMRVPIGFVFLCQTLVKEGKAKTIYNAAELITIDYLTIKMRKPGFVY